MLRLTLLSAALALSSTLAMAADFFGKRPPVGGSSPDDFLPVDQAFEIQPLEVRDGRLQVSWRIAPGYYLYRQRLSFRPLEPAGLELGGAQLPAGEIHEDEHFGVTEVYRPDPQQANRLTAQLPLPASFGTALKLEVGYQGCAEAGLCYPPQVRVLDWTR